MLPIKFLKKHQNFKPKLKFTNAPLNWCSLKFKYMFNKIEPDRRITHMMLQEGFEKTIDTVDHKNVKYCTKLNLDLWEYFDDHDHSVILDNVSYKQYSDVLKKYPALSGKEYHEVIDCIAGNIFIGNIYDVETIVHYSINQHFQLYNAARWMIYSLTCFIYGVYTSFYWI